MISKFLTMLAAVVAVVLAAASAAAADPPIRTFAPAGPITGEFCPAPMCRSHFRSTRSMRSPSAAAPSSSPAAWSRR